MSSTGSEHVAGGGPAGVAVGDIVVTRDGALGSVERIIATEARDPAFLVVAVGPRLARRYPVIPCALVTSIDPTRRRVHIRGRRQALVRVPETVPLVL